MSARDASNALPEPLASLLRDGLIVCPRTASPLTPERDETSGAWVLRSRQGAVYPVHDGIPVLTPPEAASPGAAGNRSGSPASETA